MRFGRRTSGPKDHLLAGSEVDILADGRLDYDDETLASLDLVVASPHVALRQTRPWPPNGCVEPPGTRPSSGIPRRLIPGRPGLDLDMEALVDAALEGGTALEINANPSRLDLRDVHVRIAVEAGCPIAINTTPPGQHPDFLRYGVVVGRRGRLDLGQTNCPPRRSFSRDPEGAMSPGSPASAFRVLLGHPGLAAPGVEILPGVDEIELEEKLDRRVLPAEARISMILPLSSSPGASAGRRPA